MTKIHGKLWTMLTKSRKRYYKSVKRRIRRWKGTKYLERKSSRKIENLFVVKILMIYFALLSGIICYFGLAKRSYIWVTGPREGGSVRGYLVAAVMVQDRME